MLDDAADRAALEEFVRLVEAGDFHGLLFQHLDLCERRAWLHMNRVDYAHLDERMARGTALHDTSRPRDTSVSGLAGLSPDRIDRDKRLVIEAKGGAGAAHAVLRQTAFYALMMTAATGEVWNPAVEVIGEKRLRTRELDSGLLRDMLVAARRLTAIRSEPVPHARRKPLCPACSYRFLCGYA